MYGLRQEIQVFGKIIELKRRDLPEIQGGTSPFDLTTGFDSDVTRTGPRLAESSRISHINFGRESYFAIISESSSPKPVNVHVTLDPKTKLPQRASCGCFRAHTRSYCSHVAAFVRFLLRTDEETGELVSMEEDFTRSFWSSLSQFGYKHLGDAGGKFKAELDHAVGGIRISLRLDDKREALSFVPGPRLIEEHLHEFFDIISRDIDPLLFRRVFGKKLKQPNVPSLRIRPWQVTQAEEDLNKRGIKSEAQHYEESMWHRIAKLGYLLTGRQDSPFHFNFFEHRQELSIEALDENDDIILRFVPPRAYIGTIIELAEEKGLLHDFLFIHPVALKTGYRIEVAESSGLRITPVVENPDPDAGEDDAYLDRPGLEDQLYGSYYFFPDHGFFHIAVQSEGLPSGFFSANRVIEIPPEQVGEFLRNHGDRLREDPAIFMDESLHSRELYAGYDSVTVEHKEFTDEGVALEVSYRFDGTEVSLKEILEAGQNNRRYLVRGEKWIDTRSPAFAYLEGIDPGRISDDNTLTIPQTDYLRFMGLHENVEKHYSSTRLAESFKGLETLKAPSRLPSVKAMKGKLRAYQRNGFGWLWFLYRHGFSGLLCDDMGLGKTHQIMALMTGIMHRFSNISSNIRFLVICPTTVLSHWEDKVRTYCPHLKPYVHHGTDRSFADGMKDCNLVITSYGIALRDIEMLADNRFELIVLDEVQAVKNKSTKTYAAIKALDGKCTIGLTGTPIENSLTDLKALFDIVLPGYLMSDSSFDRYFREPIEEVGDKTTEQKLSKTINPFVLRRTKEQVLKELPPKIEDIRKCAMSEDQIKFYRDVVHNRGTELVNTLKDPDKQVPYMHVFSVLNTLKQICNHPAMLEHNSQDYAKYESGKWSLFTELLNESLGSGQKVVVFSQYVIMLELIEAYLRDQGIEFTTIKGKTRKRAEAVKRFNEDPDCMVFSASLRASGLGIDLTGGSVVIHYDRWWNSAREDQATDRVHRIGQNRGVQVFKLVTENTLEEKIDRIIDKKKRLMNSVVKEDDQSVLKHFSREDLIELMTL